MSTGLSVQAAQVGKKFRANAKFTNLPLQIRPYNGKKVKGATSATFYFGKIKFGDFSFPNRLRLCKYCSACFNVVGKKRKKQQDRNKQIETNRKKQIQINNQKETTSKKQLERNKKKEADRQKQIQRNKQKEINRKKQIQRNNQEETTRKKQLERNKQKRTNIKTQIESQKSLIHLNFKKTFLQIFVHLQLKVRRQYIICDT